MVLDGAPLVSHTHHMARRSYLPVSHYVDVFRPRSARTVPCPECDEPAALRPGLRQVGWRCGVNGKIEPKTEPTDYGRCYKCGWDEGRGAFAAWEDGQ